MSTTIGPVMTLWRSELIASIPGVVHGVTRRVPGLGRADGNVGFSAPRDREDAWQMRLRWCEAAGLSAGRLVTLGQIHGTEIHIAATNHAGWGARPGSTQIGYGDGLATGVAGPVLMTLHADCQPLLFVDPGSGRRPPAVAVAHAGWRGTVTDIAGATLTLMASAFGSAAEDVHVALGPAIGACCYEVGADVAEAWHERAGGDSAVAIERHGSSYRFSLTEANRYLLNRAGVQANHIDTGAICTRCAGDEWFSHRGQGPDTGRFGAMIALTKR
jgi:purine-nucleoside/S-methyl-5'-thioadenosine phosphorylase / adenosine deaminase